MGQRDGAIFLITSIKTGQHKDSHDKVAATVKGKDWQWILYDPLYIVALRIWGLFIYYGGSISGECMALFTQRLLEHESKPGGPYYDDQRRLDLLTNCAIARLFDEFHHPLPLVRQYINETVLQENIIQYDEITRWILLWPMPLNGSLLGRVTNENYTPPSETKPGKNDDLSSFSSTTLSLENNIAIQYAKNEIARIKRPLKSEALQHLRAVMKIDRKNQEISRLSYYFVYSHSLLPIITTQLTTLGAANILMWIAYTIYDDLIDEDAQTTLLPLANMMHRFALSLYNKSAISRQGRQLISRFFDDMDEANRWELEYCRASMVADHSIVIDSIPVYGRRKMLARRAHGHTIGPALLALESKDICKQQYDSLCNGLDHYLIARQLNDDIYDWVDDLKQGHISFVVAFLLESSGVKRGSHDVAMLITTLQRYFWDEGLERLLAMTLRHTQYARRYFLKGGITTKDNTFFECTIVPIERAVRISMASYKNKKSFLKILYMNDSLTRLR